MFAEGQLLVREQYLDQVLGILGLGNEREFRADRGDRIRRVIAGVVLITTGPATDTEQFYVPDVLATDRPRNSAQASRPPITC